MQRQLGSLCEVFTKVFASSIQVVPETACTVFERSVFERHGTYGIAETYQRVIGRYPRYTVTCCFRAKVSATVRLRRCYNASGPVGTEWSSWRHNASACWTER